MDNSLKELLAVIEPKILNIETNRIEKSSLEKVHETMCELVEIGSESYQEIFNFYDQEFIYKAIKIGNPDADALINKYESSRYLLKTNNEMLHELPQYKDALEFMGKIYKYLYGLNERVKIDYENKADELKVQELLNKYYNLLTKETIFIEDIDEFITFLDLNDLDDNKRLDILMLINKYNIKKYTTTNNINIGNNLNLSDIYNIINDNKELINQSYDSKNKNYLLNDYLKSRIDDLENALYDRKIYLVNLINKFNEEKKYYETVNYIKEFNTIKDLEREFLKQKECSKKLKFLMKNDKSLVRDYLEKTSVKYKSCILKNLLDLEQKNVLNLPIMCYNMRYIYLMDDFVVKTIFTYVEDYILVIGVLDKDEELEMFLNKNDYLIENLNDNQINEEERNIILKDTKLEDLVVSIDLDTLDVKMEDKNGR